MPFDFPQWTGLVPVLGTLAYTVPPAVVMIYALRGARPEERPEILAELGRLFGRHRRRRLLRGRHDDQTRRTPPD